MVDIMLIRSQGANLSFPIAFGIGDSPPYCQGQKCLDNTWLIGFINSCPYIAIAVL